MRGSYGFFANALMVGTSRPRVFGKALQIAMRFISQISSWRCYERIVLTFWEFIDLGEIKLKELEHGHLAQIRACVIHLSVKPWWD